MTTTYAAVHLIANGKPYISLGQTFAAGATITSVGPVTLNSSDGTGASKSVLGAVITDPQNNVVGEISWVDPETAPVEVMQNTAVPVGLNYALSIITVNS